MMHKSILAAGVFTLALVVFPVVAGAHAEIESDGVVAADGTVAATLHLEEECPGAGTTTVELNFPPGPVLSTVAVAPAAGWTSADTVDPGTKGVSTLTLTRSADGAAPLEFALTLGPIPAGTESVTIPVLQTCPDGEVIRWIDPIPADGSEPDAPAPVLTITSFTGGGASTTSTTTTTDSSPTTKTPAETSDEASNSTGIIIGVIAAALVLGGGALLVMRRRK